MAPQKLYHLAKEWNIEVLTLLQLAKHHDIPYTPSAKDKHFLKGKLAHLFSLSDLQYRTLEDVLSSPDAQPLIEQAVPILEVLSADEQELYLSALAEQLAPFIKDEDLKRMLTTKILYETIMNLGVVTIYRSNALGKIDPALPAHLQKLDPKLAYSVIKRNMLQMLETMPFSSAADIPAIRKKVSNKLTELLDYAT